MKVHKIANTDFVDVCVKEFVKVLTKLQQEKSKITIALSGGSTPIPILKKLRKEKLDWSKFHFFMVDERNVPIDNEQSNYGNIQKIFFNFIPSKSYSMINGNNLDTCVELYHDAIIQNVTLKNDIPAFDLIVLGMGDDGHIASLFPNSNALEEKNEFVLKNYISKLDTNRITLTYPVIKNAKNILMLIKGAKKEAIFKEVYSKKTNYPVQKIADWSGNITWIIGNEDN